MCDYVTGPRRRITQQTGFSAALLALGLSMGLWLALTAPALAHVTVQPKTSSPGGWETYTIKVPNEKDVPTTAVRVVMPEGANFRGSGVKPGWNFETAKKGETVTEIKWSGGEIPVERFDTFQITVQNPAKPAGFAWKAYQTYANGEVVAWVEKEGGEKPASVTEIKAEPKEPAQSDAGQGAHDHESEEAGSSGGSTTVLSLAALALAAISLAVSLTRRQAN